MDGPLTNPDLIFATVMLIVLLAPPLFKHLGMPGLLVRRYNGNAALALHMADAPIQQLAKPDPDGLDPEKLLILPRPGDIVMQRTNGENASLLHLINATLSSRTQPLVLLKT